MLKRNVRFDDVNQTLIMDVKLSQKGEWKTINFEDVKAALMKTKSNSSTISRGELVRMVASGKEPDK